MKEKELIDKYPNKQFGSINIQRKWDPIEKTIVLHSWGPYESYNYDGDGVDKGWEFYLDHSCDQWVIGSQEEAEQFSKDLIDAIQYAKKS